MNRIDGRLQWMKDELDLLKRQSQQRLLTPAVILAEGWVVRGGRRMLNLASNNYLGLFQPLDAALLEEFIQQAAVFDSEVKLGSTASRLINGNDPIYGQFEQKFAEYKGTGSCLVFSNGYMANTGIISSLVGRNDLVFSDRLNHASIVDGITLSRAENIRYRHRDMNHLETLLSKADPLKKKLIVTDTIFSMDGSIAPLQSIVELKNKYGALLMVDEAHSGGVYGEQGQGLAHSVGLMQEIDVHMGTFSKAYGCYGAYAAGDSLVIEYLINKARSFIYTTSLPPVVIQAVWHNWTKVREGHWRRRVLQERVVLLREGLKRSGFNVGESESQIVPLIIGDNDRTVLFSDYLQQHGVAAVAVRPPTVPEGEARVRFTLMATHRVEDLAWALDLIERAGKKFAII
ncbi:MAG TPA: 8-amino-7-oxononanoate synthase [Bacilli bacterium]